MKTGGMNCCPKFFLIGRPIRKSLFIAAPKAVTLPATWQKGCEMKRTFKILSFSKAAGKRGSRRTDEPNPERSTPNIESSADDTTSIDLCDHSIRRLGCR